MGLIAHLFRRGPKPGTAGRIRTATASQRDMDALLELTWRQRVRCREEKRAAAKTRAAVTPVTIANLALRRLSAGWRV